MLEIDNRPKIEVKSLPDEDVVSGGIMSVEEKRNAAVGFLAVLIAIGVIFACVVAVINGLRDTTTAQTPPTAIPKPRIVTITQAHYPGATVAESGSTATITAHVSGYHCTQLDMESQIYYLFGDLHQKLGIDSFDLTLIGPNNQPALHVIASPQTVSQIDWTNRAFDVAWLNYDTKDMSQHMVDYASC